MKLEYDNREIGIVGHQAKTVKSNNWKREIRKIKIKKPQTKIVKLKNQNCKTVKI